MTGKVSNFAAKTEPFAAGGGVDVGVGRWVLAWQAAVAAVDQALSELVDRNRPIMRNMLLIGAIEAIHLARLPLVRRAPKMLRLLRRQAADADALEKAIS